MLYIFLSFVLFASPCMGFEPSTTQYSDDLSDVSYIFFNAVAVGSQDEAKNLLQTTKSTQDLLKMVNELTDYSGRTFRASAYEYAYWAKDTHMRRMLESFMDEKTRLYLLKRIEGIEQQGLTYWQYGKKVEGSKQFDFTMLINALKYYNDNIQKWYDENNWDDMQEAWMAVGMAQREVPAHVAQEYCREDRSFAFIDDDIFHEPVFPRTFLFMNFSESPFKLWFPLSSPISGLGYQFALMRGDRPHADGERFASAEHAAMDYAAMIRLDKVRTADLKQSKAYLLAANH